jgi:APA family basic amino acid/polyamine antiporter
VTIGEFFAFLMGWNLALEYIITTASTANALTGYIDLLIDYKIKKALTDLLPLNIPGFGSYVNLFSLAIVVLVTCLYYFYFEGLLCGFFVYYLFIFKF